VKLPADKTIVVDSSFVCRSTPTFDSGVNCDAATKARAPARHTRQQLPPINSRKLGQKRYGASFESVPDVVVMFVDEAYTAPMRSIRMARC